MSYIGDELRGLRKAHVRLNRRLALANVEGEVIERDKEKWLVRLKLGEDPETGEPITSPWLRPSSQSNQPGFKVSPALPPVGSKMRMVSPSGVVGAASYAEPAGFDDEQKRPNQDADESVISYGKTRLSFRDGTFTVTVDGKGYELTGSEMKMTTTFRAKGGSRPAAYKGAHDSAGDVIIEGNDDVLV